MQKALSAKLKHAEEQDSSVRLTERRRMRCQEQMNRRLRKAREIDRSRRSLSASFRASRIQEQPLWDQTLCYNELRVHTLILFSED